MFLKTPFSYFLLTFKLRNVFCICANPPTTTLPLNFSFLNVLYLLTYESIFVELGNVVDPKVSSVVFMSNDIPFEPLLSKLETFAVVIKLIRF